MYDELVKSLRDCAKVNSLSLYKRGLMKKAADAIEELQKRVPKTPHGRLIDADALEKDIDKYIGGEESRSRFHHWVQVQRTVIPESKEART